MLLAVLSAMLIEPSMSPLIAAPPEVEQLIKQLRDKDEAVRLKAAKELGRLNEKAKDAIPALTETADDPDEDVREVAKKALAAIKKASGRVEEKGELTPLVKDLKAKDSKVRLKALAGLESKGKDAKDAARSICELIVYDPNPTVATTALTTLEKVRPDLYKHLSVLLLDNSAQNRLAALQKLADMKDLAEPAQPILLLKCRTEFANRIHAFEPDGSLASPANSFLGQGPYAHHYLSAYKAIAGAEDPEVIRIYRELAASTNKDAISRRFALKELVAWAEDDEALRKDVIPFIKAGLADGPLLDCITYAGGYGSLSKEMLPVLKRHKLSAQAEVRDAASKAVDQIESGKSLRAKEIRPPSSKSTIRGPGLGAPPGGSLPGGSLPPPGIPGTPPGG